MSQPEMEVYDGPPYGRAEITFYCLRIADTSGDIACSIENLTSTTDNEISSTYFIFQ
jgi:hypothetical protein